VYTWGRNDDGQLGLGNTTNFDLPQKIKSISNVSEIHCGEAFLFAKNSIEITFPFSFIYNDIDNGTWYAWGLNSPGRLGLGHTNTVLSPTEAPHLQDTISISCGAAHTLALYSKLSS
jgi:alpha-tubulin suppressor-like RCC1 family protein